MKTNFNIQSLIRPNVASMKPYSSARDEFKDFEKEMIFLDANENPFDNGLNRYPDPNQIKLKKIFSKLKSIPTNQILLGNGSDEVLDLILRAFCEPNQDNIITLPPTYGMYSVLANLNAVENREVLLSGKFQIDVEGVVKVQDENSKLLFICSPNNPTGTIFNENDVERLIENFNGLVVVDEAYIDFASTKSWVTQLSKYPNLIVTQTLSKAYGMAGIRLGICYASAEIISVLNKIKPPYNVNELTQNTAIKRIENISIIKKEIALLKEEKNKLSEVLLQIKYVEKIYSSEANFLLIKVDDAQKRYNQLIKKGIVVRNRGNQPLCENTIRISVGTEAENQKLLTVMRELQN